MLYINIWLWLSFGIASVFDFKRYNEERGLKFGIAEVIVAFTGGLTIIPFLLPSLIIYNILRHSKG